jgi:hypothetical protein
MLFMAGCYHDGKGVSKDKSEAMNWLRKAAELGDSSAMFKIGQFYQDGDGVGRDEEEAVKWYRKAAELGSGEAKVALKKLGKE